jgi:hypothetical protein
MMYHEDRLVISVWWMAGQSWQCCMIRVMIDLKAPQPENVFPWQASDVPNFSDSCPFTFRLFVIEK